MEHDVYAPPMAAVADVPAESRVGADFQPVGKLKFFAMFLGTFGLYTVVWMYRHWALFKRNRKIPMWPVARGLFPIFFTHSLTEEIDHNLKRAGIAHAWSPSALATGAVVSMIGLRLLDRFTMPFMSENAGLGLTLVVLVLVGVLLWKIQHAANLACGEPEGESNRSFGVVNWIVAILGGLWWLLVLVGMTLPPEVAG